MRSVQHADPESPTVAQPKVVKERPAEELFFIPSLPNSNRQSIAEPVHPPAPKPVVEEIVAQETQKSTEIIKVEEPDLLEEPTEKVTHFT